MHPYISQTLVTEHITDVQRAARAARLAAEVSHRQAKSHRWGIAERAIWQRLVRSA
jgi:hypothetical protein